MTHPARIIALHTLIGAISEGGDAIIERYRREGPSPHLDAMIAAYRVQISLLLAGIESPEPGNGDTRWSPTGGDCQGDHRSSPHRDYSLEELQLMGLYP